MKKTAALILVFCLLISCAPAGIAADVPSEDVYDILTLTGIMTRNSGGDFRASQYLTRAQLAKVLVAMSSYRGLASAESRTSPFSDVPYTHWASSYVRIASSNGMMVGYTDGTFRPDQNVLYEEAVTAMLSLLGYTKDDFSGGYPYGQLYTASEIGLTDDMTATAGKALTRGQAARLVYNALCSKAKGSSETYAESLGYSLTNGILTLGDAMSLNAEGPVTVTSSTSFAALGLNPSTMKVYINEGVGTASQIGAYDIVYYNVNANSVWVYNDKVSGVLEAVSPNREAPSSVTVSGTEYTLSSYTAQKAFGYGGLGTGQYVTLLLGRDGGVADAYGTGDLYDEQIGVVIGAGTKEITVSGTAGYSYYASVLLPGGDTMDLAMENDAESYVGRAVRISYTAEGASISSVTGNSGVYGTVSATGYAIGSGSGKAELSGNVRFIEYDDYGNTALLTLSRLDGVYLEKSDISLLSYNTAGKVESVILKGVTGDTAKFGIVTSASEKSVNMTVSGSYKYYIGSASGSFSGNVVFNISKGPSMFLYDDGQLVRIKNLKKLDKSVASVNAAYLMADGGQKYKLSASVAVYRVMDTETIPASLEDAMNNPDDVTAYYDNVQSQGGLIRVLVIG